MKITRVEPIRVSYYTYVKVYTDEGITGIGELHPAGSTVGIEPVTPMAAVNYFAEYLVGQDPLQIERHWQHMFRRCLFRGGSDTMAAIGAIDIALWDIKGKAAGLPVYSLLGGPTREKVRVYTWLRGDEPDELADYARACVERGYTAVRLYPFGNFGKHDYAEGIGLESMSFGAMVRNAVARVEAVRDAVGPDVDVMIDPVNRLTPPEAIAVGRALAPYGLYFFEDPIEPENMDVWGYVAANIPMPIATGERLYTIYQFRDLLDHKGAGYVRPDISLAGGITNCKKIATLAEAYYVGIVPHNPMSCVFTAACVQLDAAIHSMPVQEYPGDEHERPKVDLVKEPLKFEHGYLVVPTTPGLGIELNEEAFKHYPPLRLDRAPLITPDGALRDY
jgi:galactonate dehydratase